MKLWRNNGSAPKKDRSHFFIVKKDLSLEKGNEKLIENFDYDYRRPSRLDDRYAFNI